MSQESKEILPPQYDPLSLEKKRYDFWQHRNFFEADAQSKQPKFCIIMPPPNVTGVLHMGHALTCTLEDILTRWKRMQGFSTLWLPGTDHAGIATQMVVERKLLKEQKVSRHSLGREKFLEHVWQWKNESQGTILNQLRLIGSSCDWSRLRFTLDEGVSRAVRECFSRLYKEGLIYRSEAITSWCPRCRTALSDLEVKFQETKGHLWHLRYVLKGDPTKWLTVATTRPETLLGDTAVAVHPDDEKYRAFHGKTVLIPLQGREISVITDSYVDKDFGSGALKITPAHDVNDYEVGKRHQLPVINIFDEGAKLNEAAGPVYQGLTREKAREKIVEDLQAAQLLENVQDHTHAVGHCDRCQTIVEPRVGAQWFVNAEVLAKEAIRAVEQKQIRIIPEEWEKTYFEWMRNIRPWCISRQLWWGHRIPVWYCGDCSKMTIAVETPKICEHCQSSNLRQEEDVLDTWFSSGLWPISTLGWPDDTLDLKAFYPTDVLETGFDILFFWVARMIMMGMKMTGKIPFREVYLHPMVRDEYGQKMSKTKGNVKDPLEIIDRMGADPLRFFLASNAFHGRDLRVSDDGVNGCRSFVNKIWNASRFVFLNFAQVSKSQRDLSNDVNGWIWSRLNETKKQVKESLEKYRFFDAAQILYQFVWTDYCSYFLELIKSDEEMEIRKKSGESTAIEVLEEVLRLLHPFMPFVTEEIWEKLPLKSEGSALIVARYPVPDSAQNFADAERKINRLIAVVDAIRAKRGTSNLPPSKEIRVTIVANANTLTELKPLSERLKKMVRASQVDFITTLPETKDYVVLPSSDATTLIPKQDLGSLDLDTQQVEKEIADVRKALANAETKLKNEKFTQSAPPAVVDGVRKEKERLEFRLATLQKNLTEN